MSIATIHDQGLNRLSGLILAGTMVQPSASLGVAVCAPGELRPDDLLHHTDMAMYNAERNHHRKSAMEVGG